MDEMLGYPKIDPHGSPIPDKEGRMEWKKYTKLSSCKAGDVMKLSAVIDSSEEFLKYLNARKLKLGMEVKVKSVEPFDGTMVITHSTKQSETLSHTVTERLLGELVNL